MASLLVIRCNVTKICTEYHYYNKIKIADCIKTIAYRTKLTPDLESVAKNQLKKLKNESV